MTTKGEVRGNSPEELSDNDLQGLLHEAAVKFIGATDQKSKESLRGQWSALNKIRVDRFHAHLASQYVPGGPPLVDDGYTYHRLRLVRRSLEQAVIEADALGPERFQKPTSSDAV